MQKCLNIESIRFLKHVEMHYIPVAASSAAILQLDTLSTQVYISLVYVLLKGILRKVSPGTQWNPFVAREKFFEQQYQGLIS